MGILDNVQPNRRYDRTQAALNELPPTDRKEIIDAILSGDITHGTIAELLTKHTTHTVDDYSVSRYKKKIKNGEVTV